MVPTLEIPGKVRLAPGGGGLPRLEITTLLAEAHIYLHGAHVAHFAPAGETPLFFVSELSQFTDGKPIRGGVPVIFPWFGPRQGMPESPMHGFARTRSWTVETLEETADGAIVVTLRLDPDDASRALWRDGWVLRHRVTVGRTLTMEIDIENTGTEPIRCEEALHTYFRVSEIQAVEVAGLEHTEFYDRTDSQRRKRQDGEPIRFTGETDRSYVNTAAACVITDPGLSRRIVVEKNGSNATVVWNPWIAKAKAMADFGDEEWPGMLCVETGNLADNALEIAPGSRHITRTTLRIEPL